MLYDLAFLLFSLFYLPALIFKGKLHGEMPERFGVYGKDKRAALEAAKGCIWIQAVSVGEVALCKNLIPRIMERFPGKSIILSTITKTGNDLARKLYSKEAIVIYFPLDFSFVAGKVVAMIKPSLYIMVETEIWPNVVREISRSGAPSVMINGRISDRSFGKYLLVKGFLKDTLGRIGLFCMQSKLDAERVTVLGAPPEKVKITGTMKFDTDMSPGALDTKKTKEAIGLRDDEELLVAGSTHPGEEEIILTVYKDLVARFPKLKLLIAPRHVERAGEVERVVKGFGFRVSRIGMHVPDSRLPTPDTRIFILDQMGVLSSFYSIATIVYIGGSLVKHGGQNPLEAAALERPIVFGPHMFNFRTVTALLVEAGAAVQVRDARQLSEEIESLLKAPDRRSRLGASAKKVVDANRGVTERNVEEIVKL